MQMWIGGYLSTGKEYMLEADAFWKAVDQYSWIVVKTPKEMDYMEGLALLYGSPAPEILLPGDPNHGLANCCAFVEAEPHKPIGGDCFITFLGTIVNGVSIGKAPSNIKHYNQVKKDLFSYWKIP